MIDEIAEKLILQLNKTIFSLKYLQNNDVLQGEDLKNVLVGLESAYYTYLMLYNSLNGPVALTGYIPVEKTIQIQKSNEPRGDH